MAAIAHLHLKLYTISHLGSGRALGAWARGVEAAVRADCVHVLCMIRLTSVKERLMLDQRPSRAVGLLEAPHLKSTTSTGRGLLP
mgnify:CR=1 FL=1